MQPAIPPSVIRNFRIEALDHITGGVHWKAPALSKVHILAWPDVLLAINYGRSEIESVFKTNRFTRNGLLEFFAKRDLNDRKHKRLDVTSACTTKSVEAIDEEVSADPNLLAGRGQRRILNLRPRKL